MQDETAITRIGKALAHPLRERMLRMLTEGERCGCEFAPELNVDASIVSRYLAVLQRAGLVISRRDGVRVLWALADSEIIDVLERLRELTSKRGASS
jgi:ArsR family transcriptional regulator